NATPLMAAVGMGRSEDLTTDDEVRALKVAAKLLGLGADINAASAAGRTALHAAVYVGANSLVEFLVKNGARMDVANGCGRTPLSLAKGENGLGLLARPKFRKDTVALLHGLGAADTAPFSVPAGRCVLG